MRSTQLSGRRVAILVASGFEQSELEKPRAALDDAGARTLIVSPERGTLRAWKHAEWGDPFPVDLPLSEARVDDFDALLLPGGVINPDRLRLHDDAIALVRGFADAGKPIAAICHGPWTLIDAGAARGRTLTSWPSLRQDLRNAGATWVDQEVVVDNHVVTSRKPDDIPAFNRAMVTEFSLPAAPQARAS